MLCSFTPSIVLPSLAICLNRRPSVFPDYLIPAENFVLSGISHLCIYVMIVQNGPKFRVREYAPKFRRDQLVSWEVEMNESTFEIKRTNEGSSEQGISRIIKDILSARSISCSVASQNQRASSRRTIPTGFIDLRIVSLAYPQLERGDSKEGEIHTNFPVGEERQTLILYSSPPGGSPIS